MSDDRKSGRGVGRHTPVGGNRAIPPHIENENSEVLDVPMPPASVSPLEIAAHFELVQNRIVAHVEQRIDRRVSKLDVLIVELATYKERTDNATKSAASSWQKLDEVLDALRAVQNEVKWARHEVGQLKLQTEKDQAECSGQLDAIGAKIADVQGNVSRYESGVRSQLTELDGRIRMETARITALEARVMPLEVVHGDAKEAVAVAKGGWYVAKWIVGALIAVAPYAYLLIKKLGE